MKVSVFVTVTFAFCGTSALAQLGPAKERSGIMRTMQDEAYNPIRQIARDQRPYESAVVDKAYGIMEAGLAKVASLWPPGSSSDPKGRYASSPKVWENRSDFEARRREAQELISASKAQAVSGLAGLKDAAAQVNKACSGCHEVYRIRQ